MLGVLSLFGVYAGITSERSLALSEGLPSMETWRSEHMQAGGFGPGVWGLGLGFGNNF